MSLEDLNDAALPADGWFDHLDTDADDQLGPHEVQRALTDLGLSPRPGEGHQVVRLLDRSGTGRIDRRTFSDFLRRPEATWGPQAELRATFRLLDVDGDGFLSPRDLQHSAGLPAAEAHAFVRAADHSGTGHLSFPEFAEAWSQAA